MDTSSYDDTFLPGYVVVITTVYHFRIQARLGPTKHRHTCVSLEMHTKCTQLEGRCGERDQGK